jgi:hypothetical protein
MLASDFADSSNVLPTASRSREADPLSPSESGGGSARSRGPPTSRPSFSAGERPQLAQAPAARRSGARQRAPPAARPPRPAPKPPSLTAARPPPAPAAAALQQLRDELGTALPEPEPQPLRRNASANGRAPAANSDLVSELIERNSRAADELKDLQLMVDEQAAALKQKNSALVGGGWAGLAGLGAGLGAGAAGWWLGAAGLLGSAAGLCRPMGRPA